MKNKVTDYFPVVLENIYQLHIKILMALKNIKIFMVKMLML